ncbi:MAG: hypothetical protein LC777_04705 [Actinobacteria bacterium]|nr:hypothetical protein [Actinomycetota bacterium]
MAENIEDEEAEIFAHMRQVIDADELRKLGDRVEAFKKVAPTRPHPNVLNKAAPASRRVRRHRCSTACETSRPAVVPATERGRADACCPILCLGPPRGRARRHYRFGARRSSRARRLCGRLLPHGSDAT